jgi:hypothetical protein
MQPFQTIQYSDILYTQTQKYKLIYYTNALRL